MLMKQQEIAPIECGMKNAKENLEIYRNFTGFNSSLTEMYACAASLYTWKKFIKNSTVLVHTDNLIVCKLLNEQPNVDFKTPTLDKMNQRESLIDWIKLVLFELSHHYSIAFVCKFIESEENELADSLSRFLEHRFEQQLVDRFKRVSAGERSRCLFVPLADAQRSLQHAIHPNTLQTLNYIRALDSLRSILYANQ